MPYMNSSFFFLCQTLTGANNVFGNPVYYGIEAPF